MKIILSRKGFDSSVQGGGRPSFVYNDQIFSIPIPEVATDIKYDELKFNDTTLLKVMRDLNINQYTECHLDPLLTKIMLPSNHFAQHWPKALGQGHIAESTLSNHNVGKGDLFVFFGWFNRIENHRGKYRYIKFNDHRTTGVHLIYGYLEVGNKINIESDELEDWVKTHPHYKHKDFYIKPNVIYTAADNFSKNTNKPGAGIFKFKKDLILTEIKKSRTNWELPDFFHPDFGTNIKYLPRINSRKSLNWEKLKNGNAGVKASPRGQEFVVMEDPNNKISNWAVDLINRHEVVA